MSDPANALPKVKIVYNNCHGGFSISDAGLRRYAEIKGVPLYPVEGRFKNVTYWTVPPAEQLRELEGGAWYAASLDERQAYNVAYRAKTVSPRDILRDDIVLVQVVEELGDAANGAHAKLRIAEIAKGERYRIDEYDGAESVMTVDDYEWSIA